MRKPYCFFILLILRSGGVDFLIPYLVFAFLSCIRSVGRLLLLWHISGFSLRGEGEGEGLAAWSKHHKHCISRHDCILWLVGGGWVFLDQERREICPWQLLYLQAFGSRACCACVALSFLLASIVEAYSARHVTYAILTNEKPTRCPTPPR
jgi:hypothetical protein